MQDRQNRNTVGILNEGSDNKFTDNVFDGLDIG